ncbi:MAG TPA: hypothetical protein VM509_12085 [Planctomycetota bacterium]|nr:hypothetical protein [Planctomycetota bacterium]
MAASWRGWTIATLSFCGGALACLPRAGAASDASRHRLECFELRASADGPALGSATLHRTDSGSGTLLEWQIRFAEEDLSIWHAESEDDNGRRWVWREGRARAGRSVVAETLPGAVDVTEWGRPAVWRRKLAAAEGCFFPLQIEERVRKGELAAGTFQVFDPLANAVETVRLTIEAAPGTTDELRRAELVRDDGSLAGSWTFHGSELVSFTWQRGGLVAVRADRQRVPGAVVQASIGAASAIREK